MTDPDHRLSPFTGLVRAHWQETADQLLLALRPHASADGARILPPGRHSSSGPDSDGLEGFARSFLIAALLIAGEDGHDPSGHAERYARGLAAGADPGSPTAWPRPATIGQAKVEAASIALGLDLTRPWIWDRLDERTRVHVLDWLREVIGTEYPPINWVWFRIVVLTFLRSEDPRCDPAHGAEEDVEALRADLRHDLAVHESCAREGGWFTDGAERAVDHYGTWAFAVFPTLWRRMRGADHLRADGLLLPADDARHRERLAAFSVDAMGLIGADGGPLLQGRSLIYRMAVAAAPWAAALEGLADGPRPRIAPGSLRRAASGVLDHFLARGVPDGDGLLTLGWFHEFGGMAQSYSGPGSPYWAAKGFLGLALPADHPVWTAVEEPLPVERDGPDARDAVQILPVPGWLASRTREDGIVRVINHGNDHALPGSLRTDSPLYARLGYSTVTSPPVTGPDVLDPRDQTVAVVHPEHGWSHRTGFETLALEQVDASTGLGISRQRCHWVLTEESDDDHGSGRGGQVIVGAVLTVASVVRGAAEVRIVRAEGDVDLPLAIAGWPLSGPVPATRTGPAALQLDRTDGTSLHSSLTPLRGDLAPAVHREGAVSPLGPHLAVPQLLGAGVPSGAVCAVVVHLGARPARNDGTAVEVVGDSVHVTWPDAAVTEVRLPAAGSAG